MQGSLYESAVKAGADSRLVTEAAKLFSHKIDFAREIHPSDQFKLVFSPPRNRLRPNRRNRGPPLC